MYTGGSTAGSHTDQHMEATNLQPAPPGKVYIHMPRRSEFPVLTYHASLDITDGRNVTNEAMRKDDAGEFSSGSPEQGINECVIT